MGIEYNEWDKPIAYHLHKTHPGNQTQGNRDLTRERILADEIIHLFVPIRISATRGIPWMHTAMTRMKMVNGYEEAELVGARLGASKAGFYTQKETDGEYSGDLAVAGTPVNEITPGEFEVLPQGWGFETYDPQHPNAAFKDFMKVVLRGIASGLDVSYNTLANDLEGVNYSSLRSGKLDERDVWKDLQSWLIEHLLDEVFADFLDMSLITQAIALPYFKYEKFNAPSWLPRGFAWVDPLKDAKAAKEEIAMRANTITDFCETAGRDFEEIVATQKYEQELLKAAGLVSELEPVPVAAPIKENLENAEQEFLVVF
jgi:lambda family phage portal protein